VFQQNFLNWTSGNEFIDKFIQESQLNAQNKNQVLEWIPYNRFKDIEYLDKGGFSTIYKAIWMDGYIVGWSNDEGNWIRHNEDISYDKNSDGYFKTKGFEVALKSLNKSSNLSKEFLNEVYYLRFNWIPNDYFQTNFSFLYIVEISL